MSILYANQSPEDIMCQEELDAVAKDPRVKVHLLPVTMLLRYSFNQNCTAVLMNSSRIVTLYL